jgi:cytochrome b561
MSIRDAPSGYGWLSIGLHWFNAVAVVMLWFVGNKMVGATVSEPEAAELLRVHTSVGVTVYAVIWVRIGWRFYSGHPKGLPDQGRIPFLIARTVHYTLLILIASLLISGPLVSWYGGEAIELYSLASVPSPIAANDALHEFFEAAHRWGSNVLFVVAVVHMTAAARQLVFARGETARRMTSPTGH